MYLGLFGILFAVGLGLVPRSADFEYGFHGLLNLVNH